MRTHGCGQLTEDLVDQTVTICGWLHRRRDHGKLTFFDLRDRSGIAQVTFHAGANAELHEQVQHYGPEYVLQIEGKVRRRPKGTENPKLPSGMVEIGAQTVTVLNQSEPPPFEIDDELETSDDVRMQWRYIDLRRPKAQKRLILRHQVVHAMRQELYRQDFMEIETPILTKSTPEGARDYLVPSRVNPGHFYALPQSPQLFKQLLMVSGFEKYYQIARCFRDEDLRADRQPEFTQLDMEMSFMQEDDVFNVMEAVLKSVFKQALDIDLPTPFPRMTFAEAQSQHGSDKPDLSSENNSWAFCWITDFPMFFRDETTGEIVAAHHPFTAPNREDLSLMETDPEKVRARAYDLVLNGAELCSGSVRIHQKELQKKVFDILGMDSQTVENRFGFLLKAFDYGAPPHAGIALGLDRLVALMSGTPTIRDVIAFPKSQRAVCPLTDAPSDVSTEQLKDLGITVVKKATV